MYFPPYSNQTESLDDVLRHATNGPDQFCNGSGHGGTAHITSPLSSSAVVGGSIAATISHMATESVFSEALGATPTIQAVRVLCDRYLETYRHLEELARDTAWWASEAAVLRAAHAQGKAQVDVPCASPFLKERRWDELIKRTLEVVELTHHTAAAAGLGEDAVPPSALSISREKNNASGEVNVLQLDRDDQTGVWESLEIFETSPHGRSVAAAIHKDEECLRILQALRQSPSACQADEGEQLDSLRYLLKHRPELIVEQEYFLDLQQAVLDRACSRGEGGWTEAALSLFQSLSSRAQLDYVHAAISAVSSVVRKGEQTSMMLVGFLHRLLVELPQGWLPLLDKEVTDIFLRVLTEVIVPFGWSLSSVDPYATWLSSWCARPSLTASMETVLHSHRYLIDEIAKQLPSSHAACVLLTFLPHMKECSELTQLPVHPPHQSWQGLCHTLLRLLCGEVWQDSSVYMIGAAALSRCIGALSPSDKESCFEVASRVVLRWVPSAASLVIDAQFVFALRLITALITRAGESVSWCTTGMWQRLDGPLFAKSQALLMTREPPMPSSHVPFRTATLEISDFIRECWVRMLQVHAPNLPTPLALLMRDVLSCGGVFRWVELVCISTTVAGWAALQPHLQSLRSDGAASRPRWGDLLTAIVEVGGGAVETNSDSRARLFRSNCAGKRRELPGAARLRSITPNGVALLLRWSTCAVARDGLSSAAREASQFLLGLSPYASGQQIRWPLLWPTEMYPKVGRSSFSLSEEAWGVADVVRAGVCYQSIYLLLESIALPTDDSAGRCDGDRELLDSIWGQLVDLWLDPAQLTPNSARRDDTLSALANRPPFGEESLLILISSMALCVLVRPTAEFRAWFEPAVAQPRIRQLRQLCEKRRGVDPIYFMVRFITSGKGRKRLPAIFLDGFEALLTIDTVCDVGNFSHGEALPIGDITVGPFSSLAAGEGEKEEEEKEKARQLQLNVLRVLSSRVSSAHETKLTATLPTGVPETVVAVIRTLLANRISLRLTWEGIEECMVRRSAEEWASYANTNARVVAVCNRLEEHHSGSISFMRRAHVDFVFLVSLCFRSWLGLSTTHSTPARRKLYWTALEYFSEHGIDAYDALVARSIALHVERALRESAAFANDAVIFPASRSMPLPSALFVFLLVRPFSLAVT